MSEHSIPGGSGSIAVLTPTDGVASVRAYGAIARAFAAVLVGEADASSVARTAFLRLFRERTDPVAGTDRVRVLMAVRQVTVERGNPQSPKGARWLRETAACSNAMAAAILGVGVADIVAEIQRDIQSHHPATSDARCIETRAELHDLMVDGPMNPRAAAAAVHIESCSTCAAVFARITAARLPQLSEVPLSSSLDLTEKDFERVLHDESRSRTRSRILPWVAMASMALVVLLIWSPWSEPSPKLPGATPPGWWQGKVSSPVTGALLILKGFHGTPPTATVTIGPNKEFLIQTQGFAIVPAKIADGGGMASIPKGKIGKIGFDGSEAWWEGGDDMVRHLEEDEARRVIAQTLGFLDVIQRVVRGVESRTLELEGGTPDTLEGEKVTRYSIKLPGVGDLVRLAKVYVLIGEDGVLRQLSTGVFLVRMNRMQVEPNENPCSWRTAVPKAVLEEGK